MKSMTGFGHGKASAHQKSFQVQIEVSVRAVNGRFLETRFHVPREYFPHEADLKKILQRHFDRGTLDIFVSRRIKGVAHAGEVIVNKHLAKEYLKAYRQLAKELNVSTPLHTETFARLPDVIKIEEDHVEISTVEKKALHQAFEKACKACEQERLREGRSLKADLEKLLHLLGKQVQSIQALREEVNQNLMQKYEQRIRSRLTDVVIDSQRLSQEVVIQLEKSDINEELTRLREHIQNYEKVLSMHEAVGKKLDFYTQELLREVNTIGSKSNVSKLTQIVVEAKTIIERLREQVQNVE